MVDGWVAPGYDALLSLMVPAFWSND
jgi:hypothetical protein